MKYKRKDPDYKKREGERKRAYRASNRPKIRYFIRIDVSF